MQYIVNEVHGKSAVPIGNAKIFGNLSDAIKYVLNENKNQRLSIDDKPFSEAAVQEKLKEKLSSVSISNETEKHIRWLITAF